MTTYTPVNYVYTITANSNGSATGVLTLDGVVQASLIVKENDNMQIAYVLPTGYSLQASILIAGDDTPNDGAEPFVQNAGKNWIDLTSIPNQTLTVGANTGTWGFTVSMSAIDLAATNVTSFYYLDPIIIVQGD
jgi:hypothetical protein